jgi:hypothetical protein
MKDLNEFEVQEMNSKELKETDGGIIPIVKIYEPLLRKLALPNIFYIGIILFSKMTHSMLI